MRRMLAEHMRRNTWREYLLRYGLLAIAIPYSEDSRLFVIADCGPHGHGQGYTDLNFLIPDLVSGIAYRKGPYYADECAFSAAGAAHIEYGNTLDRAIVQFSGGSFDYNRGLLRVVGCSNPWSITMSARRFASLYCTFSQKAFC